MIRRTALLALAFLMLTVAVTLAGCSKDGKLPTGPSGLGDPPVISSFTISPSSGPAGTLATLTWAVTGNQSRVGITASSGVNPGTGFATSGSTTVSPTVTTAFTLTATNPTTGGSVNSTVQFTVK
jgi:hypothetical protein